MKEKMRSALQQAFPAVVVSIFTDLETSLAAAGAGLVIVLLVGTGSAAIGRDSRGKIWRAGGYGTGFSDEGSAFDIGRRAVARAMKERDRKGSDSSLGKEILEQLAFQSWAELQRRSNLAPDEVFPKIFPIVAAAADAGDSDAREILSQAATDLSSLVVTVANHQGSRDSGLLVAKTGGAVGRSAFFDAEVDAGLKRALPQARIGGLQMTPAEAAARAARH
jgi:N-acetylglucosamine kinase-like BadF-type ATPase